MMMRSCWVAAATPSTTPSTLTRPSWPPRMMSRSDRPMPLFSSSGSCSVFDAGAGWGAGSAIRDIFPRLASAGGLSLTASATAVHDQVGVARHELVFIRDVVQHRDHVVALDVQSRAALIAHEMVVIRPLLGEFVVAAVAKPGLLDEAQLLQHLE